MGKSYFIANPGSSSRRYAWYKDGVECFTAHFDQGKRSATLRLRTPAGWEKLKTEFGGINNSARNTFDFLENAGEQFALVKIDAWGVRIVAPSTRFQRHVILDAEGLIELESKVSYAPLHLGPALDEIRSLTPYLGQKPLVGISDSAFHATLPDAAREYAISTSEAARLDLFRFGYHGLSVESVTRRSVLPDGTAPLRLLVCHLGGGASITAVKEGRSIDTSMGFTPLEGLIMATRAGDIDAGAVFHLTKALGNGPPDVMEFLQSRSGLLGISGSSSDVRELLVLEAKNDRDAGKALNAYAYRVRKYIGSYFAILGGIDMIVFTAGIGGRSPEMRSRICAGLEAIGVRIHEGRNQEARGGDAWLHAEGSTVAVRSMETREMDEMEHAMKEVLNAEG